jgi:hypothetical protein
LNHLSQTVTVQAVAALLNKLISTQVVSLRLPRNATGSVLAVRELIVGQRGIDGHSDARSVLHDCVAFSAVLT